MSVESRNLEVLDKTGWHALPGPSMRKYVTGRCFDFALALKNCLPLGELVVLGTAEFPDHAALRLPDGRLVDVRGATDNMNVFLKGFRSIGNELVVPVGREALEYHCNLLGVEPPYRESADIREAMASLHTRFRGMRAVPVPRTQPVLPAP